MMTKDRKQRSTSIPKSLKVVAQNITQCELCPRLRKYCTKIARVKRKAYRTEPYWGKPVPGFGDYHAKLLIVGLAPAAHGGNRTGRAFTGDSSGDFLFRALHRRGFANQPQSIHPLDGLRLKEAYITAVVHCAPPDNKPLPQEQSNCQPYLAQEIQLLSELKVVLALGKIALDGFLKTAEDIGWIQNRTGFDFNHGKSYVLGNGRPLLYVSYHPSRQNTQTGRLTQAMFDKVFLKVRKEVDRGI